ncbi:ABC transporter permease, partial [Streptomyces sp. NPDC002784]
PRAGRALGIQQRLAGSGLLPRSVSLGVGLPFARPGRSALTLAAVVLGVTTVTFATGLATTMTRFGDAGRDDYQVTDYATNHKNGKEITPEHSDLELHALLRSLPAAIEVTARANAEVRMTGTDQEVWFEGRRGDEIRLGGVLTDGRWMRHTGEVVASSAFLRHHDLRVGDRVRLEKGERRQTLTVVGAIMDSNAQLLATNWSTLTRLAPQEEPIAYHVKLREGADPAAYARAARAADPGISPAPVGSNTVTQTIVGSAMALTLMLTVVAALGVFNTVVLNTQDRRRDLGMLKSIGMTPRQVIVMTMTSMAVLGAIGSLVGIPLGMAGHHLVVPRMADAVDIDLPSYMMDVWQLPALAALALAGLATALLGAFIPARRAARLTIAQVLHNE